MASHRALIPLPHWGVKPIGPTSARVPLLTPGWHGPLKRGRPLGINASKFTIENQPAIVRNLRER